MNSTFKQIDDILSCFMIEFQEALDNLYFLIMQEGDPATKRAALAKLNKYRDFWLHGYSMRKSASFDCLHRQLNEIQVLIEKDNIGNDLQCLIEEINKQFENNMPRAYLLNALIFKTIHLIKLGFHVIPADTKKKLIEELNKAIIKRNQLVRESDRVSGVIIELKPYDYTNYRYDTALIVNWNCQCCGHQWHKNLPQNADIFAPIECPECRRFEIGLTECKKLSIWRRFVSKISCVNCKNDRRHRHGMGEERDSC